MKKWLIFLALVLSMGVLMGASSCSGEQGETEAAIQKTVAKQDTTYNKTEPIPLFNYSLPRHMWIQYYVATTTKVVRTWSCETALGTGHPMTEVLETVGFPIPADTQLTNPQKLSRVYPDDSNGYIEGNLMQAEPNGLYTSQNTDATIYFTVGDDGSLAPNYAETKVVCKPYPFHWDEEREIFVRDKGAESTLKIDTKGAKK